jgi:hypothetical protein
MSTHHIQALANLANMHYIATQIHARTPIRDETGNSVVDYMNKATEHLNESMFHSTTGDAQKSLFSLRQTYQHTHGVLGMLLAAGEKQYDQARKGELPAPIAMSNMNDMQSFTEHHSAFLDKGKDIVANEQEKGLSQIDSTRQKLDNARDVVEGIADEQNLLLPGSWVNRGDGKSPNGE